MRSWCHLMAALMWLAARHLASADDKPPGGKDKPDLPKQLAPWYYPGATVAKKFLSDALRLHTADDIDKVYRHYEKLATRGSVKITLPGGFLVGSTNGKANALLDLSQAPDAAPKKMRDRPVKVRVLAFQVGPAFKPAEATIIVVLSRGKDEKATDIAVIVQRAK